MEKLKTQDSKTILYYKGTCGCITISDFKLYFRAIVTKTADIGTKTVVSMEMNGRPYDFWQNKQDYTMEKLKHFQQMVLAKLNINM